MSSVKTKTDISEKISAMPLFKACGEDFLERLTAQAQLITLEKNQVLFVHEDESTRFFLITKGWIKLFRETFDGTQAVVDILTSGHLFGETSIFQSDKYPYSAEATERSEVISMPLSLLKTEIEANPKLALAMLSSMARYRRQQDQELEHRTIQNASQRIGCFLLRLTNQEEDGSVTIHLPYDKTLVASRLGMQPETFSRALGKLKNETGIEIKGATITMKSLDQLSSYSCAACSSDFPCKDLKVSASSGS
ncbi:MAG TPA: Crp/Fnr family transcriptional regulator [Alphaproteobacteria bacterium]|nr:Crp/Fnr family transcriptional regulator [Alphaproteobacteria bacterium]